MSSVGIAPSTAPSRLKVIHAGFFRTGTNSLATAYQILGFKAFHGLLRPVSTIPWQTIERAAEATWPDIPGAPPRPPFTRADWDELWGQHYDVVTDISAPFTLELIKAYPEAKVVIVQRDFETWWPSFKEILLDKVMGRDSDPPWVAAMALLLQRLTMCRISFDVMRKICLGFFGAQTKAECQANARLAYQRYHEDIRRLVPEERRLEYRLGDGWGPLCEFLGVEVPDVEFPRKNARGDFMAEYKSKLSVAQVWGLAVYVLLLRMLRTVAGVLSALGGRGL